MVTAVIISVLIIIAAGIGLVIDLLTTWERNV